jgi:hypothetical protein
VSPHEAGGILQFFDPTSTTWILQFAERSIRVAPPLTWRTSVPLAKLSERFYQRFGHDSVEELVTWLNQMDTTYRTDLREVNELNFARFDAKLEQRASELDAKIDRRAAEVKAELHTAIQDLRVELRTGLSDLRSEFKVALEAQTALLVKWMLGFWVMTVPTLAGVLVVVQHFLPAARP